MTDICQLLRERVFPIFIILVQDYFIDILFLNCIENPFERQEINTSDTIFPCLCLMLTRFKLDVDFVCPQRVGVMVASHNEDTVRFTLQQMQKNNIKPEDKVGNQRCPMNRWYLSQQVICFGQLLGMCDNLSFPLGETDLFERLYCETSSVQAKQASACTSTFRTVPSTRCSPTFPGASNCAR